MSTDTRENSLGFGNLILRFRKPIGLTLIAITIFIAYWAVHVPIATRFEDLFPAQHPKTLLYREFRNQYGGAQTLVVLLRVQQGDIFNPKTLLDIQQITREVDALSGVNHNEIFSLASYRVVYARAEPGALLSAPYMYPDVPKTQDQITDLKNIVLAHREQLAGYYTRDGKGALVIASFNERRLDYKALFDGVQDIILKHEDANTRIYASGAAMFSAWGYHYLPRIQIIFALSIALMLVILYLSLGRRTGWWAPIVTGTCSAIWGLGFVSLMDFNFDPVMLVIPLILTARDLSHGIQWHGRYYDELDRTDDKMRACAATADVMFAPGLLAVLANIAGIIFIAVSDIPVLRQIGFGGAVWLGASLAMVFVFQPILMSYLSRPQIRERGWLTRSSHADQSTRHTFLDWLVRVPVTPGILRTVLIVVGAFFIIVAVAVVSFETLGTKPMNMLLHNGFPKYLGMPDNNQLSANLWSFFFGSTAPGEANSFFAYSPAATNTCIRLLLPDHTYTRLTRLRDDLDTFMRERVKADPLLDKVKVRYIGGDAGLYLATDDVISRLNVVNLALVLAAIFLGCAVMFRSLVAGALFVLSCVMANFGAFVYMNARDIGLTADTIPIISLGIGLGIAYGIYTVARIRDEVMYGSALNDAVTTALRTTGAWVFATFAVMVAGMLPWVFSPLLFHNEMSVLLILLMSANMIAGLLILPAVIAWTRPRFITRYEQTARAQPTVGAAAKQATS